MNQATIKANAALRPLRYAALAIAFAAAPALLAQTATVVGWPSNFDAVNDTGEPTHGFEIEVDGVQPSEITRIFGGAAPSCVIRYCTGSIVPFAGGVYIRWVSPVDPNTGHFTIGTPVPNGTQFNGESCWTGGLGSQYNAAGCEHFGISTSKSPTAVVYRWLVENPTHPGTLVYYSSDPGNPNVPPIPVAIPQPVINVVPPAQAGGAPGVNFAIQIPAPPRPPRVIPQWGTATWVKVYELELPNEVDLNDLLGGNAAVPDDVSKSETPWKLLQTNPNSPNSGVLNSQKPLGNGSHSVVRRYEFYKYNGAYDPSNHEALCIAVECASPQGSELGDFIGAQMAAANLDIPSITVTNAGNGTVTSSDGKINCGRLCTNNEVAGTSVTLTAHVPSDGTFNGFSGDCQSATTTCAFTIQKAANVTATFAQVFGLSVSRNGNGVTTATPGGAFNTSINCGSSCSAKFPVGTAVTITATPNAGHTFVNWGGACSGSSPVCTVTISKDTSVQANFK
ncbi:MAG TPA: hypothetical protein VHW24_15475 [Bryobacteraceae bacterium]|jgi:hypothetical protein|nr:hypothetical protein [Bryobacteraceae bacterium]